MQHYQDHKKKRSSRQLALVIVILILVNIAAYFLPLRADLTADNRFTITKATKELLQQLPQKVSVTLFLAGDDLPAAFRRLSNSTQDMLQNFQAISHNQVSFRIVDPLGADTTALATLSHYRMSGVPVTIDAGKKGTEQKMLFPWALVTTQGSDGETKAFPVFLQEVNTPELSRTLLNKSEILLEYNLANAIHQVTKKEVKAIAYLTGNGETFGPEIIAAFSALQRYYRLDTFNLQAQPSIPSAYDAIIINRPLEPFSEVDKFKIDQYLMSGKSVLWNIDGVTGTLDSLRETGRFNAMPLDLNLDDLLFHYGVRVNGNLLEDAVKCAGIPLMASNNNGQPVIFPWVYFPVLQNGSDHPIVRNLNGVLGRFVSTIDTNSSNPAIRKTVLLTSSDYSATLPTPAPILLESAMVQKNPATFRRKNLIAAMLLEGSFSSVYAERMPPEVRHFVDSFHLSIRDQAQQSAKMILAADGALMKNEFSPTSGPSDLGVYRFSDYRFDNKDFLLNCMAYLTDPNNLLEARAKTFQTHLLDPRRVMRERSTWQTINIGVPAALILLLGAIYFIVRKRRYG